MDKNISLDYYKIFYEVAKHGNITKASQKLFISQPAITQTIKKLEEKLGVTLFIRSKQGITLTDIGMQVFKHVNSAILEFGIIDDLIKNNQLLLCGTLRIGCSTNLAKKVLAAPILEFGNCYSNIEIIQTDAIQQIMLNQLELGEIDICFTQKNNDITNLEFVKLFDDKFVLVYNPYLIKSKNCILQAKGSYNRRVFDEYIKDNFCFDKVIQIAGYNLAITLALQGLGYALVPYYLAKDYVSENKLTILEYDIKTPSIEYGYYYNKNNLTKITQKFIEFLESKLD